MGVWKGLSQYSYIVVSMLRWFSSQKGAVIQSLAMFALSLPSSCLHVNIVRGRHKEPRESRVSTDKMQQAPLHHHQRYDLKPP